MKVKELLDAGDLISAIEQVTREVKTNPTQDACRILLFELLSLAGEWDRAEKQLQVLLHMDATLQFGVQVYLNNIKAEKARLQLFSSGVHPHFITEPPAYVDLLLNAIREIQAGRLAEARQQLERAEEERPALPGTLNGIPFSDFRDASDLTGSVLELIIHDKYTWVPWEQIKRLEITPPRQLRDMIWTPVKIESHDGAVGEVFVFSLYPGSCRHENPQVRLGRMTEWKTLGEEIHLPVGLRLFLADEEDKSIFEAGSILFEGQHTPKD